MCGCSSHVCPTKEYLSDDIIRAMGSNGGGSNQPGQASPEDPFRQDEGHLRSAIDTTPALINTGLPDGYLDFFNQTWLKYGGVSMGELQGWAWTAMIHPQDLEGTLHPLHLLQPHRRSRLSTTAG